MKFRGYIVGARKHDEFEVTSKVRTNVRGHFTYVLQGVTDDGIKANVLVNQSQWDKFDVPIEERAILKKVDRKGNRVSRMKARRKFKRDVPKERRQVYNKEVEEWLAEHYGLDLENLTGE